MCRFAGKDWLPASRLFWFLSSAASWLPANRGRCTASQYYFWACSERHELLRMVWLSRQPV